MITGTSYRCLGSVKSNPLDRSSSIRELEICWHLTSYVRFFFKIFFSCSYIDLGPSIYSYKVGQTERRQYFGIYDTVNTHTKTVFFMKIPSSFDSTPFLLLAPTEKSKKCKLGVQIVSTFSRESIYAVRFFLSSSE